MKNGIGVFIVLLLGSAAAWATITLTSSQVQTYAQGGNTVETDSIASVTDSAWNYGAETVRLTLQYGSTQSGSFVAGKNVPSTTIVVDAQSGTVSLSDGTVVHLTAAQQSAIVSTMKTQQNTIESALINWGILSGTQVAN